LHALLQSAQPGSWDFQVKVEQEGQPKFADAFSASTMFFDLRKQARKKSNWEMKGLFEEEWNKGNWVKWQSTRKLSVSSTEECSLSVQLQHDELFEEKSQEKINRSFLPKILLDSKSAKKLRSMIQHPESLEKIEEEMSLQMGKDPSGLKSKCSSGQSVDGCRSAFANLIADQQIFVVEQDNRGKFECDELDARSDYFSREKKKPKMFNASTRYRRCPRHQSLFFCNDHGVPQGWNLVSCFAIWCPPESSRAQRYRCTRKDGAIRFRKSEKGRENQ
jgi:hypothetical protein